MDVRGEQRLIADRYLLLERLGSGGMGTVWRATDQLLRRTVALKEVHLLARGEELARRSRRAHREARAIAGISHPNVVDIYDLVDYENRLWLVMELVEGPSLANIAAGSMSPARVAEIGLQLLSALDAVHAVGALHRDVKPSNILLRPDGGVVLCDFGIVALADTESLTQSGAVVGSVEYIAPERLGDQPVGPPSDLFSLGCTLYYLLTGNSPFARPGVAAVLHAVIQEQPDIPKNAGLLGPLIEALLRKNPAERPSVTEAVDMLASVATAATIREFNIGSWSTVSIKPRRRRLFRWVASLAVLVVVSIVGFLVAHSLEGTPPVSDAERTTPVSIPPDSAPRTRVTHIDAMMATPDDPNQFWIFAGSEYVRISLEGDGSAGRILVGPLPIANWTGTFKGLPGFESKIDAVMPVPGQRNRYWVFSGDQYIQIEVADEPYEDTLLTQPAPLSEWDTIR